MLRRQKAIIPLRPPWHPVIRFAAHVFGYLVLAPGNFLLHRSPFWKLFYRVSGRLIDINRPSARQFGDYVPDEHDVVVCSYAKCGTNWSMQVAQQIAHYGDAEFEHIHTVAPWPDGPPGYAVPLEDRSEVERSPTRQRIIKTHLSAHKIPYSPEAKYFCVVRDPKDAFVSGYVFFRAVAMGRFMMPVHAALYAFLQDHSLQGSWAVHCASFWEMRDRDNVLFVTFEEMKRDLPSVVDRCADLMGVTLTPEQRTKVIEKSSFAYMREQDFKFNPNHMSPLALPDAKLIRSGKSGDSGSLITPEQQRMIDASCKETLRNLGCDFPYDEEFALAE